MPCCITSLELLGSLSCHSAQCLGFSASHPCYDDIGFTHLYKNLPLAQDLLSLHPFTILVLKVSSLLFSSMLLSILVLCSFLLCTHSIFILHIDCISYSLCTNMMRHPQSVQHFQAKREEVFQKCPTCRAKSWIGVSTPSSNSGPTKY